MQKPEQVQRMRMKITHALICPFLLVSSVTRPYPAMFDPTAAIFFATVIVIFTLSLGYSGFKQWLKHRASTGTSQDLADVQAALEEAEAERNALKKRIQHLEAIAAAEDDSLEAEFSALDTSGAREQQSSGASRSQRQRS